MDLKQDSLLDQFTLNLMVFAVVYGEVVGSGGDEDD